MTSAQVHFIQTRPTFSHLLIFFLYTYTAKVITYLKVESLENMYDTPRTTRILDGRNSQKYLHQAWADLLTLHTIFVKL